MLNDLLAIENGLAAHGVDLVGRHPDIKDMAKGWAFRTRLDCAGRIASLDIVSEAGRGAIWTLRRGQHNGFPGLKTAAGLLSLDAKAREDHDRAWEFDKTSTGRRNELLRLLGNHLIDTDKAARWPKAGHRKRIKERLEVLRPLGDDSLTAAIPATFERFLIALDATPSFLEELTAVLSERIRERGDEWLDLARAALLGPVALAIDIKDDDFERDAGDPRQIVPVSVALSGLARAETDQEEGEVFCALSGRSLKLHAGNFPQPNLPGLGQTYIFSRNRDIPSLTRYGRTADASFPIDSQLVRRLSGAIAALTKEEAKGQTWRLIPAEAGDRPDLLVVSFPPPLQVGAADAVVDDDDKDEDEVVTGSTRLCELASRVLEHASGEDSHGYAAEMAVLVLRTVDPANRKAIYHRPVQPEEFFDAAKRWDAATANAPREIRHWIWIKKDGKSKLVLSRPLRVSPTSITSLSRMHFADGGKRRVSVRGVTFADAFGLFLEEGNIVRRAQGMLDTLLRRHTVLLSVLSALARRGCDKDGKKYIETFDQKNDLRRDALRSTAWISALLYKIGRSKEVYMADVGFRLGQLLAAADIVHIGYCADMRGGDIPMTLIGNAVFASAGSNPKRALSILQGRWKPYDAWAKPRPRLTKKIDEIFEMTDPMRKRLETLTAQKKDAEAAKLKQQVAKIEASGWAMRNALAQAARIRRLAPGLAADLKSAPVTDTFRAELLLGYMAGLPADEKPIAPPGADDTSMNAQAEAAADRNDGEQG